MIRSTKNADQYLRLLNSGIENSIGLLDSLPIKDQKILEELKDFKKAFKTINDVYGVIPKSEDQAMFKLHDETVAESLKMAIDLKNYASKQEENSKIIAAQSRTASPKGAARINVQVNAQVLHVLGQILRVNGQMLKLQSERLAMSNKDGKDNAKSFYKTVEEIKNSNQRMKADFSLPDFRESD
jgi:hypothetical protein